MKVIPDESLNLRLLHPTEGCIDVVDDIVKTFEDQGLYNYGE